jgi:hypothetical protein
VVQLSRALHKRSLPGDCHVCTSEGALLCTHVMHASTSAQCTLGAEELAGACRRAPWPACTAAYAQFSGWAGTGATTGGSLHRTEGCL